MTDRPILFSAPMVRALLAGTKTQTRRVIPEAMQDAYANYDDWCSNVSAGVPTSRQWEREFYLQRIRIQPGDRLWVRETWAKVGDADDDIHACPDLRVHAYYRADSVAPEQQSWRPSIHMPRWASRLTLYVTDVRVERLQDISEADARAEGFEPDEGLREVGIVPSARGTFSRYWAKLHGIALPRKPSEWAANPWVAAYTFVPVLGNIDGMSLTLEDAV